MKMEQFECNICDKIFTTKHGHFAQSHPSLEWEIIFKLYADGFEISTYVKCKIRQPILIFLCQVLDQ